MISTAPRDAELLYRSGLGLMALGPEGMNTGYIQGSGSACIKIGFREVGRFLSLEDNQRAATLLLNLAQTLLNVPGPLKQATIAASQAATVRHHLSSLGLLRGWIL